MESITLTDKNIQEAAEKAAAVLRRGGVVLYPTETLYGLGADALSDTAVAKLYPIKGRPGGKPIHALVTDESMAARFGEIGPDAHTLMTKIAEPISLIVPKIAGKESGILRGITTFGFRIASHPFCVALVRAFGGPVTTTSANRAGKLPDRAVPQILEQLSIGASGIDLVIDAGALPPREASTIVDLSGREVHILREGTVSTAHILAALGKAPL